MGLEVRYRGRIANADCIGQFEQQIVRMTAHLQGWSQIRHSADNSASAITHGVILQLLPSLPLLSLLLSPNGDLISLQAAVQFENHNCPAPENWCSICTSQSGPGGHLQVLVLLAVIRQRWFPQLEVEETSGRWSAIALAAQQLVAVNPQQLVTTIQSEPTNYHQLMATLHNLINDEQCSPTFAECLTAMQPDDSRQCQDDDDELLWLRQSDSDDGGFPSESLESATEITSDETAAVMLTDHTEFKLRSHTMALFLWINRSLVTETVLIDSDETVIWSAIVFLTNHCSCTQKLLPLRYAPDITDRLRNHLHKTLWFADALQHAINRLVNRQRLSIAATITGQIKTQQIINEVHQLLATLHT
jgi:hypothetical protein